MRLTEGSEVLVGDDWYPVVGFALVITPSGIESGDVFTLKPIGKFEPCLGYRINWRDVEEVRDGRAALAQSVEKK